MSTPFLGEIRLVAYNFAPKGWAIPSGQLLSIQQNAALFSLLGTTYGGDGVRTFALPNLNGRVLVHAGNGIVLGESGGEDSHRLIQQEMPQHVHSMGVSSGQATSSTPTKGVAAVSPLGLGNTYSNFTGSVVAMDPTAVESTGGSQGHENRMPSLALNYIIALQGIYPSRN